ncbi:glycosyl hydrolase family 18 protein [Paenibacillus oleatilyticus]|uniref:glycosyl hydrolase family 18 protein n=1 Tax=Paenibacillus oleatilyticus TaxID=2594886 RepID=UPI001C1FEE85|nr:glycosyl hydrolase family 18 protein [Paenibacillus oleatilyticus]MBU7316392.1 fibronectin type III domain-containing protein [Paenibacillus oleatilyticus]
MMKRKAWALLLIVVLLASLLPAAAFAAAAWAPNTSYKAGDIVSYGGSDYQCIQPHTSLVGWEPPNVPALWKLHSGGGTDTQPPTAPANLSVSGKTSTTVSLSWGASTDNVGVTGYDVYQGGALVGNAATTSYTVSGLTPSTSYTFTVKAKDAAGNVSAASNAVTVTTDGAPTDTTPPTAPTGVSASNVTSTSVSLTWTASTDNVGVTGYDVYQGSTLVGSVATTSYTVSGLTPSTSYTFTVKAKDAAGNVSAASNAISVKTNGTSNDTTPPTAPTGVSASNVTSSSVTLTWTASTDNVGVTGYDVYQGSTLVGSVATTSYTVTGLTASTSYTFTVKAKDAAGNVSAASNAVTVTTSGNGGGGKKIVTYYPAWAVYGRNFKVPEIDASKVTHINYAFADICWNGKHGNPDPTGPNPQTWACADEKGNINVPNGSIVQGDTWADTGMSYPGDTWDQPLKGSFNQLIKLKKANPHLKTLISVGGWSWSNRFSDVAADPATRSNFAKSAVDFIRKYQFDGVDLDWEYPVSGGLAGNSKRPEDKQNFTLLLQAVRNELNAAGAADGKQYLLTIASGAGPNYVNNTELSKIAQTLDWINIMTYDFHGGWESKSGHNAPLYFDPADNSEDPVNFNVDKAVDNHLNAGVPASKLVLGIPYYGKGWQGCASANNGQYQQCAGVSQKGTWENGSFDFYDLEANYINKNGYTRYWNNVTKTPFLYQPNGGIFISYDDAESIQHKVNYIKSKGLAGAMTWEVTQDRNKTLQTIVKNGLNP